MAVVIAQIFDFYRLYRMSIAQLEYNVIGR